MIGYLCLLCQYVAMLQICKTNKTILVPDLCVYYLSIDFLKFTV